MFAILFVILAQVLDPYAAQQAYTTADPNNADRLGLATVNGRYAITPIQDCEEITVGENVLIWPDHDLPPWLEIARIGADKACLVKVEGRMSETQCFMTDGLCDWNAENAPM